jgi:hypothetical protein
MKTKKGGFFMKTFTKKLYLMKGLALLLCINAVPVPAAAKEALAAESQAVTQEPQIITQDSIITPCNTDISTAYCGLTIDAHIAYIKAYMYAIPEDDKVEIEARLQYLENGIWNTLTTYTSCNDSYYDTLSGSRYISGGYEYRLFTIYKAYKGGVLQEVTSNVCNYGYYGA